MISGYCDEKFSSARELFEKNLKSGFERGAAITVEIEGEKVVDLWGGIDSEEENTTWQEDTIVNVFSTTGIIEETTFFEEADFYDFYCIPLYARFS